MFGRSSATRRISVDLQCRNYVEYAPLTRFPSLNLDLNGSRHGRANEDARLTETTINPYEPTPPANFDVELEPLRFDGVIERADYQRMLPRGELEWWLCLVLAVSSVGRVAGDLHSGVRTGKRTFRSFRGKAVGGLGLSRVLDADARRFVVSKTPDQRERSCDALP